MRRHHVLSTCAALAAALVLAACGGDDDPGSSPASGSVATDKTVAVQRVDGVGSVLVDADGQALYTSDQEANGAIRCTDGCASIWLPLEAGSAAPTADGDAATLDVIERPDGTRQVTADGKPLYTFAEDAPGEVTGDGFSDEFEGRRFTWHAALAGGEESSGSSGANDGARGGDGY
jgi:predicted lipoprotein with Yx(FWY)xxD motif